MLVLIWRYDDIDILFSHFYSIQFLDNTFFPHEGCGCIFEIDFGAERVLDYYMLALDLSLSMPYTPASTRPLLLHSSNWGSKWTKKEDQRSFPIPEWNEALQVQRAKEMAVLWAVSCLGTACKGYVTFSVADNLWHRLEFKTTLNWGE